MVYTRNKPQKASTIQKNESSGKAVSIKSESAKGIKLFLTVTICSYSKKG
jgi:hypothetical protein